MTERLLSVANAFEAMIRFLDSYRAKAGSGANLRAVLSDIQTLTEDGLPADPATWDDWLKAVDAVISDPREHPPKTVQRKSAARA